MGSLLRIATVAVALALLGAMPRAHGEGDRQVLYVGITTSYFDSATSLTDWPDGGVGKLRYSGDGVAASRLFLDYRARVTPTLSARAVADYVDDGSSGLGLTEAYMDWRPIPHSPNQQQVRFGAFYPPLSLENGAHGWESPFTYSYSAINTWLGEEIRPLGVEWSLRRRLQRFGNAQEIRAFAAGFYANDPAATLLFWRGWSLHDRQTRLNDRLQIPELPLFGANGTVVGLTPQPVQPFTETDHRPGAYAGVEWRYARRALVQLARYDNRADPWSFAERQWGWHTSFDHLGLQVEMPWDLGLIAQWMRGDTYWVSGAFPDGTYTPTAHVVVDDFTAKFLLLTRKWGEAHRVSLRYDEFGIVRPESVPVLHADEGHAWTLSYRYERNERFGGGVEWLRIQSQRDLWPYFYGVPARATEDQLRLQFAVRLGMPTHR